MRSNDATEFFVRRMGQVNFATSVVIECNQETMGIAIVVTFRAIVGAPFVGRYFRNVARQGRKLGFDGFEMVLCSSVFKV